MDKQERLNEISEMLLDAENLVTDIDYYCENKLIRQAHKHTIFIIFYFFIGLIFIYSTYRTDGQYRADVKAEATKIADSLHSEYQIKLDSCSRYWSYDPADKIKSESVIEFNSIDYYPYCCFTIDGYLIPPCYHLLSANKFKPKLINDEDNDRNTTSNKTGVR